MSTINPVHPPLRKFPRKFIRWITIREHLTGYLFILPAVVIISLFGFFPIGYAFYMSLYNWRVKQGPFIGDDNYVKAIGSWQGAAIFTGGFVLFLLAYLLWQKFSADSQVKRIIAGVVSLAIAGGGLWVVEQGWEQMAVKGDKAFLNSLPITLYYSLGSVPIELAIALGLAFLLFQKNIRAKELFRMIYFLPYITPVVATALVFRTIFNQRNTSLANQVMGLFNMGPFKWLFEPKAFNQVFLGLQLPGFWNGPSMALTSIMIFGVWTFVGYNTVIFLAGLGSISREYYEAAEIDGANKWQSFRHITLPLLSPVTFYLALVAFIGTFKAFNHIYVMRVPSAQGTVNVASVSIFDTFYKANQYGYAAAQAILLFAIIMGLTLVQNRVFGKKVFYG